MWSSTRRYLRWQERLVSYLASTPVLIYFPESWKREIRKMRQGVRSCKNGSLQYEPNPKIDIAGVSASISLA